MVRWVRRGYRALRAVMWERSCSFLARCLSRPPLPLIASPEYIQCLQAQAHLAACRGARSREALLHPQFSCGCSEHILLSNCR